MSRFLQQLTIERPSGLSTTEWDHFRNGMLTKLSKGELERRIYQPALAIRGCVPFDGGVVVTYESVAGVDPLPARPSTVLPAVETPSVDFSDPTETIYPTSGKGKKKK